MNAQFIYENQVKAPVLFSENALGSKTDIVVAGRRGRICLPRLVLPQNPSEFGAMIPPDGFESGVLHLVYSSNWPKEWGRQVSSPGRATSVGAFMFEFSVARTRDTAETQLDEVGEQIGAWFSILRDWLEVQSHQDLATNEPMGMATSRSEHYTWSWTARVIARNLSTGSIHRTLRIPDLKQLITLERWQIAVRNANQLVSPPPAHLLLRDARASARRGRLNIAVIKAAIAAEISIKTTIEVELQRRNNPQSLVDDILKSTLGRQLKICGWLGIPIPKALYETLIKKRNSAIHENARITEADARVAIATATQVVDHLSPLQSFQN